MGAGQAGWHRTFSAAGQSIAPCYCAKCRRALSTSKIFDPKSAWCPECKNIVDMTCFQVPSWVMGVLMALVAGTQSHLWG